MGVSAAEVPGCIVHCNGRGGGGGGLGACLLGIVCNLCEVCYRDCYGFCVLPIHLEIHFLLSVSS